MDVSILTSTYPAGPISAQQQDNPPVAAKEVSFAAPQADAVKLSQGAQIHALRHQGQAASQIASSLGVSVASVNTVLGIVAPTPVPAAVAQVTASTAKVATVAKS